MEEKIAIELAIRTLVGIGRGIKSFGKGCFKVAKYTAKGCYQVGKDAVKATSSALDKYNNVLDNTYKRTKEKQNSYNRSYNEVHNKSYRDLESRPKEKSRNSNDMDLF